MPAEKTHPFCPSSRVLNWTDKGLISFFKGVAPSADEKDTGRADVKFTVLLYVEHRYV